MTRRDRIHYTESDKALMWERWKNGGQPDPCGASCCSKQMRERKWHVANSYTRVRSLLEWTSDVLSNKHIDLPHESCLVHPATGKGGQPQGSRKG